MKAVYQNHLIRGVGVASTNLSLALLYLFFAYSHALNFIESPRLSVILIIVAETLLIFFILTRKEPDKTMHTLKAWLTTIGGTFLILLLRPIDAPHDLLLGQFVQGIGFMLQIGAILALNKSFGLLPANRGVKSSGLYRLVRHPLYSAYTVAHIGYLINNFTLFNFVIVFIGTAFQILRILNEEQLLSEYSDYVDYSHRTKWRLIPHVW
ncbi:MAG: methyltransferase [Pseudomonadota bacterium]